MKLKTKFQDEDFELGEVADVDIATMPDGSIKVQSIAERGGLHTFFYKTKAEFDDDWEDALEEPKVIIKVEKNMVPTYLHIKCLTEEEAEEAVRKLKAWERLKDAGLKFSGWDGYVHTSDGMGSGDHFDCCGFLNIHGEIQGTQKDHSNYRKDLDLLFSRGEE